MSKVLNALIFAGLTYWLAVELSHAASGNSKLKTGGSPIPNEGPLTRGQARALVLHLDRSEFGGFFQSNLHSWKDVMGIWSKESNFNRNNYNPDDPTGAYGIGQVLASTARDYGYSRPQELFNPLIGARVSMEHMRWTWAELTRRLGREPTNKQWIMAYNAGAAGVAQGRNVTDYYLDVKTRSLIN